MRTLCSILPKLKTLSASSTSKRLNPKGLLEKGSGHHFTTSRCASEYTNQQNQPKICLDGRQEDTSPRNAWQDTFSFSPRFQDADQIVMLQHMKIYDNFINEDEEASLLKEVDPYLSRLRYEESHWDDAIHHYRETEKGRWNKTNSLIIDRIRNIAFPPNVPQLKLVHVLDLAEKGTIKPHIDSVKFCGNTIAGLSLLSDSIMRLRYDEHKEIFCDVLLRRFSLYVMKDSARYNYTHEILPESESTFQHKPVHRKRRISVICRNEPS